VHPTRQWQRVVGRRNRNDSDVNGSRPLRPSNTIDAGTVDKCSENKFAALMLRNCCMDSNGEGGRAERMHDTETLLRYLRMCTLRVLIVLASGLVGITPE
jgi:hypothetical protein